MKEHSENDEKTVQVLVPGDVLSTNVESLREEIKAVIKAAEAGLPDWNMLELDLTAATMVDSAGLNLIVSLVRLAGRRGGKVRVRIKSSGVHRTLLFTRLDEHLEIVKL
jgi:anti-anti-sigma factor